MRERICDCFGSSGLHASTFQNAEGRECCDMCGWPIYRKWRFKFLFAWYDIWIGAFWDRRSRKLYVLPLPCVGFVLNFGDNP